ncbi:retention module-containing protein, partial [Marinomonas algarum]
MSDSQVPFATLGNTIGFISQASGLVTVQSIDGQERVVRVGDPIFYGETVVTGAGASATIAFVDGTEVLIGDESVVEINDEVYNTGDAEELVADSTSEVDALQAAILAGDDPTLVQEAPAAGEATDDQNRVDVDVERNDDASLPTFGTDTLSTLPTYGYDTNVDSAAIPASEQTQRTSPTESIPAVAGTVVINSITNDNVINSAEASGTITVSGTATGGDVSEGDTVQLVVDDTTYTTTVGADGSWTADVAGSDLTVGTNVTATITSSNDLGNTVTSTGDTTYTVDLLADAGVVTVDAITSDDIINATEAAQTITVTGTAAGGDISENDVVTMTINETVYTTTVGTDGTWSVDVAGSDLAADTAFDAVVASSDVAGNTVVTTGSSIHVVNQAPTATAATGSVTEDASITGSISAQDVDLPAGASLTFSTTSTAAGLTLNADGSYSFDASSYDSLEVGEKQVIDVPVTVTDDQGATASTTLTVTINGTNDAAEIKGDTSASGTETDAALTLGGTLTAKDVDNTDNVFTANTIEGTNGTFSIDANGAWTFVANSAFNELNVGDSKVESFNVTSADGTVQAVTVTINGTNDAAEIKGDTSASGTETDAALTLGGTLTAKDVDNTDNVFTANTIEGTNGTFSIDANGAWTFVANSAFNELNVGDSKVESFNVTSADGTVQAVTVTINGT